MVVFSSGCRGGLLRLCFDCLRVFIVAFIVILGFLWMGLCGVVQGLVFGDLLFAV